MDGKKIILFDMDGTVFDNSEGIINCIKYSLDKLGKPYPDEDTLRKFIGPALFDSYMRYIEQNEENANAFVTGYRERYAPIGTTEVVLYPRMLDVLTALKNDGYRLAVVSGKPYDFVKKIALALGFYDLFSGYYCTTFGSHSSDKTDFVRNALADASMTPDEALMVGDTLFDVRAARGAGVETLAVTYGFSTMEEILGEKPEYLAHSPIEVYSVITGKEL